ncbi:pentapeptide repeat-containing protein [Glutamicibacter sp. AOP12-B1-11]|uniref:pentapeptide repeat-containing protein n=1 Tax=Glutamicibacter sp. AOP12-B1-11 TaxID=3457725 RepID=UPI0040334C5A
MAHLKTHGMAPRIREFRLPELEAGTVEDLLGGGYVEVLHFTGYDRNLLDLTDGRVEDCLFSELNIGELSMRNARYIQCEFKQLSAPIVEGAGATLNDVRMIHSRFGSAELSDSSTDSVVFDHCKFGWVNLRSAQLRDVLFRDCTFDEIDLQQAKAQRVRFENCRTGTLSVERANLSSVDLTGLEMSQVQGIEGLRGATISEQQLSSLSHEFAAYLGLRIKD